MCKRCPWLDETKPDYVEYHDKEWGVPVLDDQTMFEYLVLESAQAGLSWYTILKRREGYRNAFANFDVEKVARFTQEDERRLREDSGIIRNKLKISSTITNAQHFIEIQEEFGSFCNYIWSFVDNKVLVTSPKTLEDYPATSEVSDRLSKDLKKRGFKFVGSTIIYAHLQAAGLINDHSVSCYRRQEVIDSYQKLGLEYQLV
ncbi:DNA-3-methyladenine glycosylase I [Vibrio mediterranei]|uniref:DNA-3-methyladenine glycosylase I n=1 Tax=Vibrio mediterranei TaxID=689 RepID=A0A3G4VCR5_9VIBR|nr:DNA-3-methyladenine glycosylase I [Vibrio mediterranei]AYV22596.1 DNA-3-methyladenine glycosylase I [Vibrio mediterranei]MCG9626137.1 DNA-3-methyladenine glycosylase I [Vibrio mediterranei]MCG9786590.1 DNA-3-methyladenine glycosylase I [Vibrio mediterranei]MCY9855198.1 DNA-3-methyladenine glycosylase I [Vibrio mediterranei]NOH27055.1 DNA-3-methyladenine glycosylase I [Vibrio mediterranei]